MANLILNALDVGFWLMVMVFKFTSINTYCKEACALSVVTALIVIAILSVIPTPTVLFKLLLFFSNQN